VIVKRISALHGSGVGHLFSEVEAVKVAGEFEVSTSYLSRVLEALVQAHPAPSIRGRNIRLKVATRAGGFPPRIAIHGNQLKELPGSYKRYLENGFRERLDLIGNPVFIDFRDSENPFAGRRNELTRKQKNRRTRIIRHKKRRQRRQ
jgi:GTP-binding protein